LSIVTLEYTLYFPTYFGNYCHRAYRTLIPHCNALVTKYVN